MLKKLLKYELSSIYKFLIIFYTLTLFFAILTRLLLGIKSSFIITLIGRICSCTTIILIINIIINNIMKLLIRFNQSLYGDESYLTHTLPIKKQTIYLSKIITGIATLLTSFLISILALFIAYYSKHNIELLKSIILPFAKEYNSTITSLFFVILIVFFLEITNLLQAGFTGVILGHQKNTKKVLLSVVFGFISYLTSQIFLLFTIFIMGFFNQDIMNLFITNELSNIDSLKTLMIATIFVYTLSIIFWCFTNIKLLIKGVNID